MNVSIILNTCDNCSVKLFTLRNGKKRSSRKSDNIFSGSVKRSEKNIKECPGLWHEASGFGTQAFTEVVLKQPCLPKLV